MSSQVFFRLRWPMMTGKMLSMSAPLTLKDIQSDLMKIAARTAIDPDPARFMELRKLFVQALLLASRYEHHIYLTRAQVGLMFPRFCMKTIDRHIKKLKRRGELLPAEDHQGRRGAIYAWDEAAPKLAKSLRCPIPPPPQAS